MTRTITTLSLDDLDGSVVDLIAQFAGYLKEHPNAKIRTERRAESLLNSETVMCNYIHVEYESNEYPRYEWKTPKPNPVEDAARKFANGLIANR